MNTVNTVKRKRIIPRSRPGSSLHLVVALLILFQDKSLHAATQPEDGNFTPGRPASDGAGASLFPTDVLPLPTTPEPVRHLPGMVDPDFPVPTIGLRVLGAPVGDPLWELDSAVGKRPVLVITWRPGDERVEDLVNSGRSLFADLQGGGVEVVFVAVPRVATPLAEVASAAQRLKLDALVLVDDSSRFQKAARIDSPLSLTFIDREGIARVVNARHLEHEIAPGVTMSSYLRAGLATGKWATVEKLPRYDACHELAGHRYRDFTLPDIGNSKLTRFSSLLATDRPTVLMIWSNPCPLCGSMLPPLVKWLEAGGKDRVKIVAVLAVPTDAARIEASAALKDYGVTFPVLADFHRSLSGPYRVGVTPSLYLIRLDGTIAAAAAGPKADVAKLIETAGGH